MIDRNEPTYIIGLDGGLRKVPAYLISDLQKQGWVLVTNPKRQYYVEWDRTNPHWKKPDEVDKPIDVLQVDVV